MEDYLLLEIPAFNPVYTAGEAYDCDNERNKKNIKKVLYQASDGYCMYCYSRILVDGKKFGQLEHAIEKKNTKRLINCVPNIGLACPVCNTAFKKKGQNERKIEKSVINKFYKKSKCTCKKKMNCIEPCQALRELQGAYNDIKGAEIILQPMGVKGRQTNEDMELQYDVRRSEFQPAGKKHSYSTSERQFIENHILRFRLNDSEFKTRQLQDFIRCVVDMGGKIPVYEYNNMIVELFVNKLKGKTEAETLKICEKIYLSSLLHT